MKIYEEEQRAVYSEDGVSAVVEVMHKEVEEATNTLHYSLRVVLPVNSATLSPVGPKEAIDRIKKSG